MSRKVRLLLTLVAISVLTLALVASASAQSETEYIRIFNDSEHTVTIGQPVVLRSGWAACSKGLTEDWREAVNVQATLSLNGVVVQTIKGKEAAKAWTAVAPSGPDSNGYCLWPVSSMWRTDFLYGKLNLSVPGDYQLNVHTYLSDAVIDGGDYDDNGLPDYWVGTFRDASIQIHVLP